MVYEVLNLMSMFDDLQTMWGILHLAICRDMSPIYEQQQPLI